MEDKKIIAAIRNRDEKMLEYVINRYSRLLWKIAANILINASAEQEIEECVADVFIYLWENPEKYNPEKGKFQSWLAMVARSRAIDRYRKISRMKEVPLEEVLEENLWKYDSSPDCDRLRECLDRLDKFEREIIIRRFYYQQKPREIAVALDMQKKQVENKLFSVKKKLRKMF